MAKSKTQNFFVWIIMGLLFVGLMGFGAAGITGNVRTVGTVGDLPISTQDYFDELRTRIRIRSAQEQRALSFPEVEAERLPDAALASVIATRALDNEAAELGISVGDAFINAQVMAQPGFRGTDGAFDRETYRAALQDSGLTIRGYETGLREDAARSMLEGAVFTGIPDPLEYGMVLTSYLREGRDFTWATLTNADVELGFPAPTDEELRTYYDENPNEFSSLETRVIRYVWLTPDMLQDAVMVDEDELRAEYDARLPEFVAPERRLVERLVFSDDAAAQAAFDAIAAGDTTFPALVAERGLTLDDVDIGDVTQDQMGDAGPAIFALENGEVTGPFPSNLGPALFRMNAILAARNITFEQALPELREDQAAARAARMIEDQIDPIIDLLIGGATLDDVAAQTEMELGAIDWTTDTTDGIAAYAAFRDLAVAQDVGDFPELADLDGGGVFAIEVLEIRPSAVIPFDDVRDDVIAGLDAQKTTQAVMSEAEGLKGMLEESVTDFAAIGLDAIAEKDITRRAFINGAPTDFVAQIFTMDIGEVRVLPNDGGAVIVRLDGINDADQSDAAYLAELELLAETGGEGIAQDVYQMFTGAVQLRTDVTINEQARNAVHTNFR